ncbi:hypothetical protein [Guptibacillus hwajinpoensis]|uniref:hypothetical protein n=1 Tax=Guptibacillus hwajinpoensis TaxID=208199 RepID=UPI003D00423F
MTEFYSAIKLENALLKKGVSKEHIDNMKSEKTLDLAEFQVYYDIDGDRVIRDIPVQNIKMTSRAKPGIPWFDLALNSKEAHLEASKLSNCFKHFSESLDLHTYYQFFSSDRCRKANPIEFEYYERNNIYKTNNGNHRTIFAKITNLPVIKAMVTTYVFNQNKYSNYIKLREEFFSLDNKLSELNFHIEIDDEEESFISYQGINLIGAKNGSAVDVYFNFKKEDFFSCSKVVTDDYEFKKITDALSFLKNKLVEINNYSIKIVKLFNVVKWLPLPIKKPILELLIYFNRHEQDKTVSKIGIIIAQENLGIRIRNPIDHLEFL